MKQWVTSVDLVANEEANENVVIKSLESWTDQEKEVVDGVSSILNTTKLDAVVCVAGGWAGGNAASDGTLPNKLGILYF